MISAKEARSIVNSDADYNELNRYISSLIESYAKEGNDKLGVLVCKFKPLVIERVCLNLQAHGYHVEIEDDEELVISWANDV